MSFSSRVQLSIIYMLYSIYKKKEGVTYDNKTKIRKIQTRTLQEL